jgi:hypothetical protein
MKNIKIIKPSFIFPPTTRKDVAAVIAVLFLAILEAAAVFNNGGYYLTTMTFCVMASWVTLIFLVFANGDSGYLFYGKITIAILTLVSLFWIWTGTSLFWSIASDLTWVEFNRTGGYLALFLIGLLLGRNDAARSLFAGLLLFIAASAAVYTIGAKALPSVIDNYENLARVSVPLGYINGTGLMSAFAVPLALYFSAERKIRAPIRLFACVSALLLLTALFFTLSRGAIYALIAGLLIYFAFSPIRIRSLVMLSIALVPTLLIASWSMGQAALMDDDVDRFIRIGVAGTLRWYLFAAAVVTGILTVVVIYIDRRITFSEHTVRVSGTILLVVIVTSGAIGITSFVITREPSFAEWAADTYAEFKSVGGGRGDVYRLFEVGSSTKRWQLWEEAIESWQRKPIYGSGAQSFPLTHLMLREPGVSFVKQPHGLLFRLLSETGLIGLILLSLFISLTIAVATLLMKMLNCRLPKGLAVAIFSTTFIYLIHTSYDWDWNMFALTMPYFLLTGILVGWHASLKQTGKESVVAGNADNGRKALPEQISAA